MALVRAVQPPLSPGSPVGARGFNIGGSRRIQGGRYKLLEPIEGDDIYGALGFLDPFAICYPGFIITGDNVRRRNDSCPCGAIGMTISDIGRVAGREVKGCGGIMAAMQG